MTSRRPLHIRATPWRTPLEERVKARLGEIPASLRRARRVETSIERLFAIAARERARRLGFVMLRLRRVLDALGDDGLDALRAGPRMAVETIRGEVEALPAFAKIRSRPTPPTPRRRARALALLAESVRRFNARWERWIVAKAPLDVVNEVIDGYNRHFAFERACAVRHVPLDRLEFEPRAPLDLDDLRREHPSLPVP